MQMGGDGSQCQLLTCYGPQAFGVVEKSTGNFDQFVRRMLDHGMDQQLQTLGEVFDGVYICQLCAQTTCYDGRVYALVNCPVSYPKRIC